LSVWSVPRLDNSPYPLCFPLFLLLDPPLTHCTARGCLPSRPQPAYLGPKPGAGPPAHPSLCCLPLVCCEINSCCHHSRSHPRHRGGCPRPRHDGCCPSHDGPRPRHHGPRPRHHGPRPRHHGPHPHHQEPRPYHHGPRHRPCGPRHRRFGRRRCRGRMPRPFLSGRARRRPGRSLLRGRPVVAATPPLPPRPHHRSRRRLPPCPWRAAGCGGHWGDTRHGLRARPPAFEHGWNEAEMDGLLDCARGRGRDRRVAFHRKGHQLRGQRE